MKDEDKTARKKGKIGKERNKKREKEGKRKAKK